MLRSCMHLRVFFLACDGANILQQHQQRPPASPVACQQGKMKTEGGRTRAASGGSESLETKKCNVSSKQ